MDTWYCQPWQWVIQTIIWFPFYYIIFHRTNSYPSILQDSSRSSNDDTQEPEDSISTSTDHDQTKLVPPPLTPKPTPPEGGTSTLSSIFLIVNAALGAGLLNLPKAFDQAGGVMTAVVVQAVLLIFIMLALLILAQTANINKSATLQEVRVLLPWNFIYIGVLF